MWVSHCAIHTSYNKTCDRRENSHFNTIVGVFYHTTTQWHNWITRWWCGLDGVIHYVTDYVLVRIIIILYLLNHRICWITEHHNLMCGCKYVNTYISIHTLLSVWKNKIETNDESIWITVWNHKKCCSIRNTAVLHWFYSYYWYISL